MSGGIKILTEVELTFSPSLTEREKDLITNTFHRGRGESKWASVLFNGVTGVVTVSFIQENFKDLTKSWFSSYVHAACLEAVGRSPSPSIKIEEFEFDIE